MQDAQAESITQILVLVIRGFKRYRVSDAVYRIIQSDGVVRGLLSPTTDPSAVADGMSDVRVTDPTYADVFNYYVISMGKLRTPRNRVLDSGSYSDRRESVDKPKNHSEGASPPTFADAKCIFCPEDPTTRRQNS